MKLIESTGIELRGKHAVVIGRSNTVGKPMALMLLAADATVTVCHSRTPDLAAHVRSADVVVAAVGRRNTVTADMVKPGAVVIDVGMNRDAAGALCGDVDTAAAAERAAAITPVPVGVPELIKGDWIKDGAVVIDVGMNRTDAGLKGDVEFESANTRAALITPVPGGVGPMTIAMLLRNTLEAAKAAAA